MQNKGGKINFNFQYVSLKEKAVFVRNLAIMIKAGLSLADALQILSRQSKSFLKKVILDVESSVRAGNSLSSSFEKYPKIFSSFFINSIHSGEVSGNLDSNLEAIADYLEKQKDLLDKIKTALAYPVIILVLSFSLGMLVSFFVLPKITPLFIGLKIDLPWTTRLLIAFADLVKNYGFFLFFGVVFFLIFLFWLFRQNFIKPLTHFIFLHTPIFKGIARNKNLALFSRTMATLLHSGLNIDDALEVSRNTVSNYYYQKSLKAVSKSATQGSSLSENLANYSAYYPDLMIGLIRVGEESGNLEEELFNLAHIYEREVDNSIKILSSAIEPALLIIIGFVVGILALSIITPIYKITGNVYGK